MYCIQLRELVAPASSLSGVGLVHESLGEFLRV